MQKKEKRDYIFQEMTAKVPYRTKHHIIDYNEEDDEFTVTVKGKRFIDDGEVAGRYSEFIDAIRHATWFDDDRSGGHI